MPIISDGNNQSGDELTDKHTTVGTTVHTGSYVLSGSAGSVLNVKGGLLFVTSSDKVGIGTTSPEHKLSVGGDIGVDQYIYHNGDSNTHINFTDDKIVLKAGNKSMITMEEKDSAPHEVTINHGGNNIDFVVEDNSGNSIFMTDASTSRVGINNASPTYLLDIKTNNGGIRLGNTTNSGEKSSNIHFTELASSDGLNAYGFSLNYNATDNAFNVMRHNNNTSGVSMMNFSRAFGNIQMGDVDPSRFSGVGSPKLWVNADTNEKGILRCSQHTSDNDPPQFEIAKARGTIESPAAVQSSDYVGQLRAMGHDGTGFQITSDILWLAEDDFTSTSRPSHLTIRTVTSGTTSPVERMRVSADGKVGIGTGLPSSLLHLKSSSTDEILTLETDEASSTASPVLKMKRNSGSPANADYLGQVRFSGENDADQEVNYAKISGKILDKSDGSEDGIIEFANIKNGSQTITARLRSDSLQLLNDTNLRVNGVIQMDVQSGDPSTATDLSTIYSKDVAGSAEVFVQDEAGNVTQISPHNSEGEWQYFSKNIKTGKVVRVNMEKMIKKLEEITGESFIEEWYE